MCPQLIAMLIDEPLVPYTEISAKLDIPARPHRADPAVAA
jgi:hypothetical protein